MMREQTEAMDKMIEEMERSYFKTDTFEAIGKGNDYEFQILSFMGEAAHGLTVANTIAIDSKNDIPQVLKDELSLLTDQCSALKEKIRNHKN